MLVGRFVYWSEGDIGVSGFVCFICVINYFDRVIFDLDSG